MEMTSSLSLSSASTEQPIASGLTPTQWVELLHGDKQKSAHKALNYLDGHQEEEMIKLLSDPYKGRKKWKERGIIPRYRNITRMVVEKSGMLFKDSAPNLSIYRANESEPDQEQSFVLAELLAKTEWQEFFINFDHVVRLLKTAVLLVQYDSENQMPVFDLLHRGNCAVILKPASRNIEALIYRTSEHDKITTYRIITEQTYIDLMEENAGTRKISITTVTPNPFGVVPAVPFYDTSTPRSGFWVDGGQDLVNMNEMVNLHITDSEFAISWAKLPTLFTNCRFEADDEEDFEIGMVGTQPLPKLVPASPSVIGGPSRAVLLSSVGVDSPFVKYESPNINIEPLDKVVDGWVKSLSADWSVRIKASGEGSATSGFQLIVEEMPNLELRKERQRMFEAGFKRMFRVLRTVVNTANGSEIFSADAELFAEFPTPHLPVNLAEQEDLWTKKIESGRATVIDYFMEVKGMSREEAMGKWAEIQEFNRMSSAVAQPSAATSPSTE